MEELRKLYQNLKEALIQGKEGILDLFKGPFVKEMRLQYEKMKKALRETLREGKQGVKDCIAKGKISLRQTYQNLSQYIKVDLKNQKKFSERLEEAVSMLFLGEEDPVSIAGYVYYPLFSTLERNFVFITPVQNFHQYIITYVANKGFYITDCHFDSLFSSKITIASKPVFISFSSIVYIKVSFARLDMITRDEKGNDKGYNCILCWGGGPLRSLIDNKYKKDYICIINKIKMLSREIKKQSKAN